MVRFHFGSDAYVTDEGWYIDDIVLTTDLSGIEDNDGKLPDNISIESVAPNPFNAAVTIEFSLPQNSREVSLEVYDLSGRMVRSFEISGYKKGSYSLTWDGRDYSGKELSTGVYLIRLGSSDVSSTRKAMLIK